MSLYPENARVDQTSVVNLIVAAKKSLAVEVVSPAHPRSQKIGTDLIIAPRIKSAKEVCAFDSQIEARRFVGNCDAGTCAANSSPKCEWRIRESQCDDHHCRPRFH